MPFEECDTDQDYLLDPGQLEACFSNKEGVFHFADMKEISDISKEMGAVFSRTEDKLNFADYILLRRINLAWQQCAVQDQLTRTQLSCGLSIIVPSRRVDSVFSVKLFEFGLALQAEPMTYISLSVFTELALSYLLFTEMTNPMQGEVIKKEHFSKAINNQVFPIQIQKRDLDFIYSSVDQKALNLPTFAALFWIYKEYKALRKEKTEIIEDDKFASLLDKKTFSKGILGFIDTFLPPDDEKFKKIVGGDADEEAAKKKKGNVGKSKEKDKKKKGKRRTSKKAGGSAKDIGGSLGTEAVFLMSFLENQHNSKHRALSHLEPKKPNPANRKLIYSIFGKFNNFRLIFTETDDSIELNSVL